MMLIDLGIKNQILAESYRLRAAIGNENDRRTEKPGHFGSSSNGTRDRDVLDKHTTGMETETVPEPSPEFPADSLEGRTQRRAKNRDREIPE